MRELKRQNFDMHLVQENITKRAETLKKAIDAARKNPSMLNMLMHLALSFLGYQSVIEIESGNICDSLHLIAQVARTIFITASPSGSEVEVEIGKGVPVRLPTTGPTGYTHPQHWLTGFYAATICRDTPTLTALAGVPISILRRSSTEAEECLYSLVETFQGLLKGTGDTELYLQNTLRTMKPAYIRFDPDYVMNVVKPTVELLQALLQEDDKRFAEELFVALEQHKAYWSQEDDVLRPEGYLALNLLAISSLAYERGLSIEVKSDYMPLYLVRGDCKGK